MKKTYQQPTLEVTIMEENLPVAASLVVDSSVHNDVEGDVKGADDWGDIWDDSSFDE
jgi:hypothetical protein